MEKVKIILYLIYIFCESHVLQDNEKEEVCQISCAICVFHDFIKNRCNILRGCLVGVYSFFI
jgi:ribonuclease PH